MCSVRCWSERAILGPHGLLRGRWRRGDRWLRVKEIWDDVSQPRLVPDRDVAPKRGVFKAVGSGPAERTLRVQAY